MSTSNLYATIEFSDRFSHLIQVPKMNHTEETMVFLKANKINLINLLKILHTLKDGPKGYTETRIKSEIRFRNGFVKYLHFCMDNGFISKSFNVKSKPLYFIETKGEILLDLFGK